MDRAKDSDRNAGADLGEYVSERNSDLNEEEVQWQSSLVVVAMVLVTRRQQLQQKD